MLTSTWEVTNFLNLLVKKKFTNYISPLQATQVFLSFSPVIEFQHLRKVFDGVDVVIEAEADDPLLNLLVVPVYSYFALHKEDIISRFFTDFLVFNFM